MASYEDLKWQKGQANWHIQHNDLCERVGQDITNIETEIQNARGTKPTLDQRLDVSFNEDGTLKANVEAYQSEWIKPALTFTYVDSTNFKVEGSQTDIYAPYRRLKINHSTSGTSYTHVVSANYDDVNNETTVTVADAVIQSDLVSVEHSIIHSDRTKDSLPRNIDADTVDSFHASQSPQANTIPVLNSSGQLALPFVQIPILVSGQDMMYREFYVDAENGDDNNDGSESAPFKTLQKAIDSVPVGGRGQITVMGDYTLDQVIGVRHKSIYINLHGTLTPIWYIEQSSNKAWLYGIRLYDSTIEFYLESKNSGKIVIPPNDTGASIGALRSLCVEKGALSAVHFRIIVEENDYHPIIVNAGALVEIYQSNAPLQGSFGFLSIGGYYAGTNREVIVDVANDAWLLWSSNTSLLHPLVVNFTYEGGLIDASGNPLGLGDVIGGILTDTNGVPRNIICSEVI